MRFPDPLIPGTLIRRYKRFLSDIALTDGRTVVAHCANPGSMLGLNMPGLEVWLSPARSRTRKLRYSWELARLNGAYIGINTMLPNRLAEEAIRIGTIAELAGYDSIRREVAYGANSRVDLLLEGAGLPDCYVEVKNVHLKRDDSDPHRGPAEFPDAVTKRGAKHLAELSAMVAAGHRAVMLYVVQRTDCDHFRLADDIDPGYAAAFVEARAAGVEASCYTCRIALEGIEITAPLPILEEGQPPLESRPLDATTTAA